MGQEIHPDFFTSGFFFYLILKCVFRSWLTTYLYLDLLCEKMQGKKSNTGNMSELQLVYFMIYDKI